MRYLAIFLIGCLTIEIKCKQAQTPKAHLPTFCQDVEHAFREAQKITDKLDEDERDMYVRGKVLTKKNTPASRHAFFSKPSSQNTERAKVSRLIEQSSIIIRKKYHPSSFPTNDLRECNFPKGSPAAQAMESCDRSRLPVTEACNSVYRTYDGSCNNVRNRDWGQAGSCFLRLLSPVYNDGIQTFRRALNGRPLPNPRFISTSFHVDLDVPHSYINNALMQFGQLISHDINLTPASTGANNEPLECCPIGSSTSQNCAPIEIARDDPFYSRSRNTCMPFVRSVPCPLCRVGSPRAQMNQITSFIDGSVIYGSDSATAGSLRTNISGMLQSENSRDGQVLPFSNDIRNDQCSINQTFRCSRSGDIRVNQNEGLTALHTLWMREHNRICRQLSQINPRWSDERLYQEARKIVGAMLQMITYNEMLDVVLGQDLLNKYDLRVNSWENCRYYSPTRTQYNPNINPTLMTDFSTAAYRFHSLTNRFFGVTNRRRLRDRFLYPFGLYAGETSNVVLGLIQDRMQSFDPYLIEDLTNFLYRNTLLREQEGLDLAAINIQRGRDHGLAPYYVYVKFCHGFDIRSFSDLSSSNCKLMDQDNAYRLSQIYSDVRDIDLFTGGVAEYPVPGGVIGKTFACIVADQFSKLKCGDRFYLEHGGLSNSFTDAQLCELKNTLFSTVVCDNTRDNRGNPVTGVPYYAFHPLGTNIPYFGRNEEVDCTRVPRRINFQAWRE